MQITFKVMGLPPKKRGDNSMWKEEADRVKDLRTKALHAKETQGFGADDIFPGAVAIKLDVFIPKCQLTHTQTGDLDGFISGVCDGLQAAHPNTPPHQYWQNPDLEQIHPSRTILLKDDKNVVSIKASKQPLEGKQEVYYTVAIETIEP